VHNTQERIPYLGSKKIPLCRVPLAHPRSPLSALAIIFKFELSFLKYFALLIRPGDTWDDVIPNAIVKDVYQLTPGGKTYPEGEPVTDMMINGWNGLNGVADP
jgi:hypothetical protein